MDIEAALLPNPLEPSSLAQRLATEHPDTLAHLVTENQSRPECGSMSHITTHGMRDLPFTTDHYPFPSHCVDDGPPIAHKKGCLFTPSCACCTEEPTEPISVQSYLVCGDECSSGNRKSAEERSRSRILVLAASQRANEKCPAEFSQKSGSPALSVNCSTSSSVTTGGVTHGLGIFSGGPWRPSFHDPCRVRPDMPLL